MITISESDLKQIVADTVRTTVHETLVSLGIKPGADKLWMSQNQAYRLVGRRKLDRAMAMNRVQWKKDDMSSRQGRVKVLIADVNKLIKES
jgi:hypothetical protein